MFVHDATRASCSHMAVCTQCNARVHTKPETWCTNKWHRSPYKKERGRGARGGKGEEGGGGERESIDLPERERISPRSSTAVGERCSPRRDWNQIDSCPSPSVRPAYGSRAAVGVRGDKIDGPVIDRIRRGVECACSVLGRLGLRDTGPQRLERGVRTGVWGAMPHGWSRARGR